MFDLRRRQFMTLLGAAAAWPFAAHGQQPAVPIMGYLDSRSPEAVANRLRGLRQGLKESGYIENENLAIAYRWAENQPDRLNELRDRSRAQTCRRHRQCRTSGHIRGEGGYEHHSHPLLGRR
jgi:hypothetical protein